MRNVIFFVRAAHSPQSANGLAEIENFGTVSYTHLTLPTNREV